MRIQVINLRRRPDRRDFMDGQAKRLGLSFDYLDAVDAKNTDMAAKPLLAPSAISATAISVVF